MQFLIFKFLPTGRYSIDKFSGTGPEAKAHVDELFSTDEYTSVSAQVYGHDYYVREIY